MPWRSKHPRNEDAPLTACAVRQDPHRPSLQCHPQLASGLTSDIANSLYKARTSIGKVILETNNCAAALVDGFVQYAGIALKSLHRGADLFAAQHLISDVFEFVVDVHARDRGHDAVDDRANEACRKFTGLPGFLGRTNRTAIRVHKHNN